MAAVPIVQQLNLLFGGSSGKSIGSVDIDAFVKEGHSMTAEVTEYPVEEGEEITDHVVQNPDVLNLEGVVGPMNIYTPVPIPSDFMKVEDAFSNLADLKLKGEPIKVVTGLKMYDNMIITMFNVDRDKDNGQSLEFTMELKNVRIVRSMSAPVQETRVVQQAAKKIDQGAQQDAGGGAGNLMQSASNLLQ